MVCQGSEWPMGGRISWALRTPQGEDNISSFRQVTGVDNIHFTKDGYENLADWIHTANLRRTMLLPLFLMLADRLEKWLLFEGLCQSGRLTAAAVQRCGVHHTQAWPHWPPAPVQWPELKRTEELALFTNVMLTVPPHPLSWVIITYSLKTSL